MGPYNSFVDLQIFKNSWISYRFDLTLLQREMLSTFVTLERLTKRPRVLDVDDAIWSYADGFDHAGVGGASADRCVIARLLCSGKTSNES